MRELVIKEIRKCIEWDNSNSSWQENFIPQKCPDFTELSDEIVLALYARFLQSGPVG